LGFFGLAPQRARNGLVTKAAPVVFKNDRLERVDDMARLPVYDQNTNQTKDKKKVLECPEPFFKNSMVFFLFYIQHSL
jgi:hypothetical protein